MKNILKVIIPLAIFLILLIVSFFSFNKENNIYYGLYNSDETYFKTDTAIAIMYETDNGNYEVSDETSWLLDGYRFNETLSGCENGGTISWNDATQKVEMKTNISDKCYVYFDAYTLPSSLADVCSNGENLANCVKVLYNEGGEGLNGLYYHDGEGTYTNADQEAGDNSYRYSGADPNNYVCFGSDAETCPEDYLYRIIGVFGSEVKLIKNTSIGYYDWNNYSGANDWSASSLKSLLNSTYLSSLSITWQNKIATYAWKVGGMAMNPSYTVKQYYDVEVGNDSSNITDSFKIGLMYVSDYGYAALPENWTTVLDKYNLVSSNNWLYTSSEWTISPNTSTGGYAFNASGYVSINGVEYPLDVRPSFYLTSSTSYVSGSGSSADPIRIS